MNDFVLDCSVAMAWCFDDESDRYADAVLDRLEDAIARVPGLWPLEMANILLIAERRGRLTRTDSAHFVALVSALPIVIDGETARRATGDILALGRELRLSSYDAAYLDLAIREGLPIATCDNALRASAARHGVPLLTAD